MTTMTMIKLFQILSFVLPAVSADFVVSAARFGRWTLPADSFKGACDLVLVHAEHFHNGAGLDLHVRTTTTATATATSSVSESSSSSLTYTSSAAVRVGTHVLEILQDRVYWNNVEYRLNDKDEPLRFTSVNGKYHYKYKLIKSGPDQRVYRLELGSNLSAIEFRFYKHFLNIIPSGSIPDFGDAVGLLGHYHDGSMWGRDGQPFVGSFQDYALEWQFDPTRDYVTLFREARPPQLPQEQCRLPVPTNNDVQPMRRHLRSANYHDLYEQALEACARVQESSSSLLDLCIADIVTTGDVGLANNW